MIAASTALALAGCGGGGGGSDAPSPAPSPAPAAQAPTPAPTAPAPINTAPVAVAGSAMKARTGATVQLDGSASSDADGDTLIYSWTLFSAPAGSIATLNNASSAKPSFTADVAGTYVASLVVNDGKIGSAASKVEIKVDAVAFNSIPSAFPPNMPSWGFQAKQTASLGDRIELAAA
ncbi:MAG TPA: PKD domain-containing protein, partial [Variovorax sp.]|nr:PKD domain-containing protein [Variovorax sp.]